jgi:hypothetical protein
MRGFAFVLAVCAVVLAGPASATVVLNDNFDGETGAPTTLNYTGFANFNVTGQVDLVGPGNQYGITGAGSYVDLDGTSGPGTITSKNFYSFNAGDVITLSFDLSPNQRDTATDDFFAGFGFSSPTTLVGLTQSGAWNGAIVLPPLINSESVGDDISGPVGAQPFLTYALTFTAGNSGSLQVFFGTQSHDNVGPLLDNVKLDISGASVPEPATIALMLGALGFAARRRKAATR